MDRRFSKCGASICGAARKSITSIPVRLGQAHFLYDVIKKYTVVRNCAEGLRVLRTGTEALLPRAVIVNPWEPWRHYNSFLTPLLVIGPRLLCKFLSCWRETWGEKKRIREYSLT